MLCSSFSLAAVWPSGEAYSLNTAEIQWYYWLSSRDKQLSCVLLHNESPTATYLCSSDKALYWMQKWDNGSKGGSQSTLPTTNSSQGGVWRRSGEELQIQMIIQVHHFEWRFTCCHIVIWLTVIKKISTGPTGRHGKKLKNIWAGISITITLFSDLSGGSLLTLLYLCLANQWLIVWNIMYIYYNIKYS